MLKLYEKVSFPMKKILSMILSIAMVLTLLPASALAVETFATSEEGIEFIKELEGFRSEPYEDRGKWYIGYGVSCDPEDFPEPISKREADRLLREALESKEEAVNELLLDYDIEITQYQFDALVSMTHTLGSQWINPTYRLCSYLIRGIHNYDEVEIVNAIGTWCHQGTNVVDHLADRRLQEAYLFLYGEYDNNAEDMYTYIHFEANGGKIENSTVFYPVGRMYGELPVPEWNGRTFLGWHFSDGTQLTDDELAISDLTVTAAWDAESGGQVPDVDDTPDVGSWVNPYTDVDEDDWYYTYVRELSAKGVVSGYPDGTFQAQKALTAGEALKLILRAAGYPEQAPTARHWASGYLTLAEQLGCLREGEVQNLDEPIDRGLIAKVTAVALGLGERLGVTPFEDSESGYLLALYEEGILEGSVVAGKRYYYPDNSIIRSEVCAIVSRISNWEYKEVNDPSESGYIEYANKIIPVKRRAEAAPYDKNLFVLDGDTMYYNDPAYDTAIGIDVSAYQGDIDWEEVADSGIEFAFIRLGFRGYGTEGTLNVDQKFQQNLEGAKEAGIKVGVYFFSQAITVEEAEEEALFVLENLAGAELDYPVVFDWETISGARARTDGMDGDLLTDCAIAFCDLVDWAGYTPMIYYGLHLGYEMYDLNRLTDHDVWYPQYGVKKPSMYYNYRIWQYTDRGTVPGIGTRVDMNLAFIPY